MRFQEILEKVLDKEDDIEENRRVGQPTDKAAPGGVNRRKRNQRSREDIPSKTHVGSSNRRK